MPDVHAKFSPSASDRLIHCPPSLMLGEQYGPEDIGSEYSREGTEAHSLGEYLLKQALGLPREDPRPTLKMYSPEMQDCAEGYRDTVLELYETMKQACPDAIISVEQQVSFEEYVVGGFGTSDCIILGDGHMYVIDYKHGKGVEVSAEENSQLKCYALGSYLAFSPLYDISDITLVIYQPRISNYSEWSLTVEELLTWADTILRPKAELALKGAGEYSCGPWCRFCKAKTICRKRAEENLKLAQHEFRLPPELSDAEIEVILSQVDELVSWASDIKEYALQQALSGKEWRGFKLVEGRSVRKYTDETAVAKTVEDAGFDPYERKLLGITAMQKLLGRSKFNELLSGLVEKPQGKPTLVPDSDKRPAMNTAKNDFKEVKNHE